MFVSELKERHAVATETVNNLRDRLIQRRLQLLDTDVSKYSAAQGRTPVSFRATDLVCCRTFQGHTGKEEVMATTSRSNQLKIRLQHIEATVPPLEKAMLAQTSHIHFAYTGGIEWHPYIPIEQNHLIYNVLPQCIMDPYEEYRDTLLLHLPLKPI